MTIPRHIIKKSLKWYYDTVNDKHIHKDALAAYVKKRQEEIKQTKLAI